MAYIGTKPADKPLTSADITDGIIVNADIANSTINLTTKVTGTLPVANGGTGLAALGTAAQELRVNSGATALEYYTPTVASSDFVKLGSITPSDANTISINGYFTSDYDIYKIYMLGLSGTSMSNTRFSFRVNVSGTAQTGSNYWWSTATAPLGTWSVYFNNSAGSYVDIGYVHNSNLSTAHSNLEMTIFRPLDTDKTQIMTDMLSWDNGTDFSRFVGGSAYNVATAISGITFGVGNFGTGNIQVSRAIIYGLKL